MIRLLLTLLAGSLALAACGGGSSPTLLPGSPAPTATRELVRISPPPRPTGVPETTTGIEQTTALGSITPRARNTPETSMLRKLLDASCADNIVVFRTSIETIYAGLSCDSFWNDSQKTYFVNKDVSILLEVTRERYHLVFTTLDGAQGEFTVQGIWVQ